MFSSHFNGFREYSKFVMAKDFCTDQGYFRYSKEKLERLGSFLVRPVFLPADGALKHIRNPLMILAMTVTAVAAVTIAFYPVQFVAVVGKVAPFLFALTPGRIHLGLYVISQATITGIGLRTLGRLCNSELMDAWDQRNLRPVPLGATIV